jgi:uncharacterized protein (DUF58 family)
MEWPRTEVEAAAHRWRIASDPRRRRQGVGSQLGAGPGASLEFHDHRDYCPGDDTRHLDWQVYARSDQLVIRRHRQEVCPRVEVLLDASASMAIALDKAALAAGLAALFCTLAAAAGARPALWLMGDTSHGCCAAWPTALERAGWLGAAGLFAQPVPRFGRGAERILVSDGLAAEGGPAVVSRLGDGAGRLCLVQVLTRAEREPESAGAVRLEDVEGGASDTQVDDAACAAFRGRLARHQAEWDRALRGRGAGLVTIRVEDGFAAALLRLADHGLIEPGKR